MRDYVFQNKELLGPVYRRSRPIRLLQGVGPRPIDLDIRSPAPIR